MPFTGFWKATRPERVKNVIDMIETLVEMRFNRGKQVGKAAFTDAIVESIVYELKR